ncbi:MAG: CBS domain-containing protein [Acidobacteriota bacterium]|nr:CBS domain-containing protein [Acidobacteriota bacterium]MDE3030636.1 CBS domain-containing protein [Acidobacteriota bacterium]MDE3092770.1 CBS domain-containing protein [Acidobacteriota bacterium]MDE3145878.1 CBS domain-containing protein [Acidobacteriota bacterium]
MQVKDILLKKGREVTTISDVALVADGVRRLHDRGVGALVVTDQSGALAGIISERDVVRVLGERGASALDMSVADVMSTEVTTCVEATTIDSLMSLMTERRIRHVPVMDGATLVGMISIGDVVKWRVDELENDKRDLIEYVTAR